MFPNAHAGASFVISSRRLRMIAERAYSEQNEHSEFRERSGKKSKGAYPGRKAAARYAPSFGFILAEKLQGHTWNVNLSLGMPFYQFCYYPKSNRGIPETEVCRQVCPFTDSATIPKATGAYPRRKFAVRYALLPIPLLSQKQQGHTRDGKHVSRYALALISHFSRQR